MRPPLTTSNTAPSEQRMEEIRFIAATGALGVGVNAAALAAALELQPHFIAADAGTTDGGPSSLGSGEPAYTRGSVKRDLKRILLARQKAGIPALVGSAGTAGGDPHVDSVLDIVCEIVREEKLDLRLAVIRSEQDKVRLKELYHAGRIRPLHPAPEINSETFERSSRIVGMMGVEPLQEALQQGAEFVLAGRCSDSALYAALPLARGFPEGLSWHAAKVVECGTLACVGGSGILTGAIRMDEAILRPIGETIRCTPMSIAAHSLYETGDPFFQKECSGTLDLTEATFSQVDDRSVSIRGSKFIPADEYTVKLEGAELVGYQSVMIGGIRDPYIIRSLHRWLDEVRQHIYRVVDRLLAVDLDRPDHHLVFHVYGRNAVMGPLETSQILPSEVGVVIEATAPTQAMATEILKLSRQPFLHHGVPEWNGAITSFAFLHNPPHLERGAVYRFNLNHVAVPDSPTDLFRTEFMQFSGGRRE